MDVKNIIIWGNHSSTQFPDVSSATVNVNGAVISVTEAVKDDAYLKGTMSYSQSNEHSIFLNYRFLNRCFH